MKINDLEDLEMALLACNTTQLQFAVSDDLQSVELTLRTPTNHFTQTGLTFLEVLQGAVSQAFPADIELTENHDSQS